MNKNQKLETRCWGVLTALFIGLSLPLIGAETFKDSSTGTEFPTTVSVSSDGEEHSLEATGASVRKKFVFKVYAIAHYMQNPPSGNKEQVISEILSSSEPKQMTMKWLRKVSQNRIVNGYKDTLQSVLGNKLTSIKPSLDKFLSFYKEDAKEGDVHVLRWLPEGKLELIVNETSQGQLQDPVLAEAFWKMWFGKQSVVVPAQLVSRITNASNSDQ